MASARLTIQNKLVTILSTISVANSYNADIDGVSKVLLDLEGWNKNRELFVLTGPQVKTAIDERDTEYEVLAFFQVMGFVRVAEDAAQIGLLNDACDALIEDIEEALLRDTTLYTDTVARLLLLTTDLPTEQDKLGVKAAVFVGLTVKYFHGSDV